MLYNKFRKEAVKELNSSVERYEQNLEKANQLSDQLMSVCSKDCQQLVTEVEAYINSMKNTPHQFCREFAAYKESVNQYAGIAKQYKKENIGSIIKSGATAGGGILSGAGTAALFPKALVFAATTYGKASTGVKIATLTGAAARSATLAWIGGGALTTGGGGMAAGTAVIALSNPIGVGIAVTGVVGGGLLRTFGNKKTGKKAIAQRAEVEAENKNLLVAILENRKLLQSLRKHINGTRKVLLNLQGYAPKDYQQFTAAQKTELGAVMNHIKSLNKLMKGEYAHENQ